MPESLAVESEPAPQARHFRSPPCTTACSHPYQRRLGLDLVQNGVAFDPGLGAGAGGQIALSDVLGNEQFQIFVANDAERFGNFWDGFEGGITYINQSQRLNYGVGLFRLTQIYDVDLDVIRRERRVGIVGLLSYPFDKFTRIEGSILVRHASDHRLRGRHAGAGGSGLELRGAGARQRALERDRAERRQPHSSAAAFTRDIASGAGNNATILAEVRTLPDAGPGVVSALRVQGQVSLWRDAQRYYLGGYNSLPGVARRALSGVQTLMVQEELRFPLVRRLVIAVPSPWEFPTVGAAAYAGAAYAWEDAFGDRYGQRIGVVGFGLYLGGGYYPALRWNFTWPTADFRNFGSQPRREFTIGFLY